MLLNQPPHQRPASQSQPTGRTDLTQSTTNNSKPPSKFSTKTEVEPLMLLKSTKSSKNWELTRETHWSWVSSTNSRMPTEPLSSTNSLTLPPHQSVKSEPRTESEESSLYSTRTKMVSLISKNSRVDLNPSKNTWTTKTSLKWCTQLSLTRRPHPTKPSPSTNSTQSSLPSTTNETLFDYCQALFYF